MLLHPNCKLNIGLRVMNKREDGYHNIETVFYPVKGLCDTLEIVPSSHFQFSQDGIAIDCPAEDNLIVRCYRRMAELYPKTGPVSIRLNKHIPFGAGLGGGSSDAAHTAVALNELFDLGLSRERLAETVTPLGADCPFFVYNTPCFARGIGEILSPTNLDLSGMYLVMLKPDVAVSTREAYHGLDNRVGEPLGNDWMTYTNDFEQTVFPLHPILQTIKQGMLAGGACYAAMSGSGSTIFGLWKQDAKSSADAYLRGLDKETAAMVLFHDTLA